MIFLDEISSFLRGIRKRGCTVSPFGIMQSRLLFSAPPHTFSVLRKMGCGLGYSLLVECLLACAKLGSVSSEPPKLTLPWSENFSLWGCHTLLRIWLQSLVWFAYFIHANGMVLQQMRWLVLSLNSLLDRKVLSLVNTNSSQLTVSCVIISFLASQFIRFRVTVKVPCSSLNLHATWQCLHFTDVKRQFLSVFQKPPFSRSTSFAASVFLWLLNYSPNPYCHSLCQEQLQSLQQGPEGLCKGSTEGALVFSGGVVSFVLSSAPVCSLGCHTTLLFNVLIKLLIDLF